MKRSRNSIICKVTDRVIIALLVTILALSSVNLVYMSRQIMKEQMTELDLVALMSAAKINAWKDDLGEITQGMADALSVQQSLDEASIRPLVDKVATRRPDLFFAYVGTEEGYMYMGRGAKFSAGMDVRERTWYKMAKAAGHTIITDPYVSASRPDVMLATVATPIYIGTTMVGVVGVDADIATIKEEVGSLNFKDGAYGFLIDSNGNIVTHPNEDYCAGVDDVIKAVDVMPELDPIIKNPGSQVVKGKDYTGKTVVYNTKKLSGCDWIIGVANPSRNVTKILDRGIRISLFMAVICLALAIADITAAISKILRPIGKINPMMDRILEGDFSTKPEITTEEDELGMLQQKSSLMMTRLSDIITKQKYVLGEMEKGNLMVEDIDEFPGDLNEISTSVNSIKESFNDIISDIQFSAINLQSFAMGINETSDLEDMRMVFEELSAEANALMEKTARFNTSLPPAPTYEASNLDGYENDVDDIPEDEETTSGSVFDYRDDF
ncbi:methyl-accepting chemotaxis protein [Pseudobutyrivibrio sp. YE44]|uniref:methyl-accepting chemotaxis protein n=1 Tax=Pseudobutyrivibrio sp. YE44 TaxID=1520802 RepID=UPI00088F5B7F|nr:methyl-accepting chemotaxis protein [Pseudobutyrivibrio sp. YE44]SDB29386.1 methyl-accepting chemotaxis protein [Pseudobutyrivibrio sp. YE44]